MNRLPKKARLGLAALVLLVVGAACSGGGDDDAGRLTVTGRAEVASAGGEAQEERGSRTVKFGDRVKVLEGTAVIRLDRGRELELRTGTNVVLEKAEVDGDGSVPQPRLLENDLLVHAPADARLTVSTEGPDVIVSAAAQVSRGPVLVVSSYEGEVELRSGDRSTTLPALRELSIAADGQVPDRPVPLSYNADDSWDRRLLGDAIETGNDLEARSKGFTAQLGSTDGRTVEFLVGLLPGLADQPSFGLSLFDALRSPGESLVGAAIALEGTRGSFDARWAAIFTFRDEGAQWGLVALDQGVTRTSLLAAVDQAIGRGPRSFETIPLPGGGGSPNGGTTSPGGGGSSVPPSGGSTAPTVPGSPPARAVPTTVPQPAPDNPDIGPVNTGIPLIDQTINALVQALNGLLRGLGGG